MSPVSVSRRCSSARPATASRSTCASFPARTEATLDARCGSTFTPSSARRRARSWWWRSARISAASAMRSSGQPIARALSVSCSLSHAMSLSSTRSRLRVLSSTARSSRTSFRGSPRSAASFACPHSRFSGSSGTSMFSVRRSWLAFAKRAFARMASSSSTPLCISSSSSYCSFADEYASACPHCEGPRPSSRAASSTALARPGASRVAIGTTLMPSAAPAD
mmetsp:Transcript_31948/g.75899  ORF Transcript_31948/g.75899 Transcript_31948/m.75899 type:complete len:222 (-) Transcript_31948:273-938(-)